jgi:transposase InsO family protein
MQTKSFNGFVYLATFINDYSRFIAFISSRKKLMCFQCFNLGKLLLKFKKEIRSNESEYISGHFIKFHEDHGISRQYIMLYTPKQNGVSKQNNCTLVEAT